MDQPKYEFFVSPTGKDSNSGTLDQPFFSVHRALIECESHKATQVCVFLRNGTYYVNSPIVISTKTEESTSTIIIKAYNHEKVTFDGSLPIQVQWSKEIPNDHSSPQIYSAKLDVHLSDKNNDWPIDKIFLNNQELQMARYPNFIGTYDIKSQPVSKPLERLDRIKTWINPKNGIIHGLQHSEWGSVHYKIVGKDPAGKLVLKNGDQINRVSRLNSKYYYIENIREELDVPGEWYFDKETGKLFLIPPENVDLSTAKLAIVQNSQLLQIKGTKEHPIHNVILEDLIFARTSRTILEPFEPLLRGDWSIARVGAVLLENAENCQIKNCHFLDLGGNGIFLNGYQRGITIDGCKFAHLGESGICVVGHTDSVRSPSIEYSNSLSWNQIDPIPGPQSDNYPKDCEIKNNLFYDLGLINKQTAAVIISMAENIQILHNTIYHLPRAGICINDGCWGGHLIQDNFIFDTVRETGDHGPFNAWGRDRHWQTTRHIKDRNEELRAKAYSKLDCWKEILIDHNRMEHRKGHCWGIDLDDGSSHYRITNNLTIGISLKLREGFFRTVENNIFISPFPLAKHASYFGNEDIIKHNILYNTQSRTAWETFLPKFSESKEIDYNLYYSLKGSVPLWKYRWKGIESHSKSQDPDFIQPQSGNYQVKPTSAALMLGFKNFPMVGFGVERPDYQQEAETAYKIYSKEVISSISSPKAIKKSMTWLGARLENITTEVEQSAFGLSSIEGVRIIKIGIKSKAYALGFRENDVLLRIDGQLVSNIAKFQRLLPNPKRINCTIELIRHQQEISLLIDQK